MCIVFFKYNTSVNDNNQNFSHEKLKNINLKKHIKNDSFLAYIYKTEKNSISAFESKSTWTR